MKFLEFLTKEFPNHNVLPGFGMTAHLFVNDGKFAVYAKGNVNGVPRHALSFQIAQGNWYFPLLDKLEDAFGRYDETYDHNGLTYYVWRAV